MSIRPVEITGAIQRVNDVGTFKQQEESRPHFQQQNIQAEFSKEAMHQMKQVQHQENAKEEKKRYDAREKGSNAYQDNRKKKNKKKKQTEEKEFQKELKTEGGTFDIKI
ncbi:MAG: hypothetical protein ACI4HI_04280 [Lachnospiraceae bacterium]